MALLGGLGPAAGCRSGSVLHVPLALFAADRRLKLLASAGFCSPGRLPGPLGGAECGAGPGAPGGGPAGPQTSDGRAPVSQNIGALAPRTQRR